MIDIVFLLIIFFMTVSQITRTVDYPVELPQVGEGASEAKTATVTINLNDKGEVIVGPRSALERTKLWLTDINWIGAGDFGPDLDGTPIKVKVRSTRPPAPAHLRLSGNHIIVELDDPDMGLSPGQACVFYANDTDAARTLGGGWITRTE